VLRYLLAGTVFLAMLLSAGPTVAIEVADAVITTAVIDREPVDEVGAFPIQNGKLFCFSRITGAAEPTFVYHLWYHGETLMSRVELPVNSPDWRTWSAKKFLEDQPGEWHVDILDVSGNLMRQVNFQLR